MKAVELLAVLAQGVWISRVELHAVLAQGVWISRNKLCFDNKVVEPDRTISRATGLKTGLILAGEAMVSQIKALRSQANNPSYFQAVRQTDE